MRFAIALVLFAACSKSSASDGLPPATDWATGDPGVGMAPPVPQQAMPSKGHGGRDVHEGVEGAPPLTDDQQQMPNDQTHAFAQQGDDQPQHGQNAPADPNKRIRGVFKASPKVADKLKPDGAIFIIVKKPDATGQPTGSALAVDRVTWKTAGQGFELGFEDVTGEVLVTARYDQDGDASTKEVGDVTGLVRVKIPADNVVLELDTILTTASP